MRATISLQESEIANIQAIEALKEAKRMAVFTITSIVFVSIRLLLPALASRLIVNMFFLAASLIPYLTLRLRRVIFP